MPDISVYEGRPDGPAKSALNVISGVVRAETARAEAIVESNGKTVRPKDAPISGPLGEAERKVLFALENLVAAEQERARAGFEAGAAVNASKLILRPKDASHPEMLGLLGQLELETTAGLERIAASERARVAQGTQGLFTPPQDLPEGERSVLGDAEAAARRLVAAEVARLQQMVASGSLAVRPVDLDISDVDSSASTGTGGPLASAERAVLELAETIRAYELARLSQLRAKGLLPERPMTTSPNSPAGLAERFGMGVFRAPVMVAKVLRRTAELLAVADLAADAEHAQRETLEDDQAMALANEELAGQIKEGVARAPVLTEALVQRTKELLDTADEAANRKGGLL